MSRMLWIALMLVLLAAGSPPALAEPPSNRVVVMKTSLGSLKLELYPDRAPLTVKNFLEYARSGFYDDTIFHRVIPGFMIQGGGFNDRLEPKETGAPVRNEAANALTNDRGTIAMARTADPDSATSQFFINLVDNPMLNRPHPDGHGYAVFGRVVEGMEVVDRIAAVGTGPAGGLRDVPRQTVRILSVRPVR